ncbi:MAG: shikimate dehydrogenase, partial [Alphaproteobacteria bacterium]|nr:shikimate dehydrogenase [Alphaproteobacteria bacterium]
MLSGAARKAGVMGWPVAHSRSPALHGWWLAQHRIDGAYVPMAVRPDQLATALRALPVLGFAGCNLTIPHKEAALALVDRLDPVARRVGAVNTIVVAADGTLE